MQVVSTNIDMAGVNFQRNEVGEALGQCRAAFAGFASKIDASPQAQRMSALHQAWSSYYFTAFRHLDEVLHRRSREGEDVRAMLAVSISHHNIHRLMEVLRLELEDMPLENTRSPERIVDLMHSCRLLRELLDGRSS